MVRETSGRRRPSSATAGFCGVPCGFDFDDDAEGLNGARGLCLEPKHSERRVQWKHVGEGNGAYECVDKFHRVGDGHGDHKEEEESPGCRWCAWLCGLLMLLIGLLFYTEYATVAWHAPVPPWKSGVDGIFKWFAEQFAGYDCKVTNTNKWEDWSGKKKDWCCQANRVRCPEDIGYNCSSGLKDWKKWPEGKINFCCGYAQDRCEEPKAEAQQGVRQGHVTSRSSTTTTRMRPTARPHDPDGTRSTSVPASRDCTKDLEDWQNKWNVEKKEYCCKKYHFGCPAPKPITPWDCEKDLPTWSTSWVPEKKQWCCAHEHVGCPTDPPTQATTAATRAPTTAATTTQATTMATTSSTVNHACDTPCVVNGATHSCKARIQWLVEQTPPIGLKGKPHSCEYALGLVLRDCAVCEFCSLSDADCHPPDVDPSELYDCDRDVDRWDIAWPQDKKRWCCQHHRIGCPPKPSPQPYLCMGDYKLWSEAESVWCCDNRELGCNA